jgi:predicted nucleic acid-binding protein
MTRTRLKLWQFAGWRRRIIMVDTNVLIYTFWYQKNTRKWMDYYAKMVNKMLAQGCHLVVNSHVISEVINSVLRDDWDLLMRRHPELPYDTFKKFRDSIDGQEALNEIHWIIENDIFPRIKVVDKSFTKDELIQLFVVNRLDFVDKLIVLTCTEKDYVLLTNDGDFRDSDVDILSNNEVFSPATVPKPTLVSSGG